MNGLALLVPDDAPAPAGNWEVAVSALAEYLAEIQAGHEDDRRKADEAAAARQAEDAARAARARGLIMEQVPDALRPFCTDGEGGTVRVYLPDHAPILVTGGTPNFEIALWDREDWRWKRPPPGGYRSNGHGNLSGHFAHSWDAAIRGARRAWELAAEWVRKDEPLRAARTQAVRAWAEARDIQRAAHESIAAEIDAENSEWLTRWAESELDLPVDVVRLTAGELSVAGVRVVLRWCDAGDSLPRMRAVVPLAPCAACEVPAPAKMRLRGLADLGPAIAEPGALPRGLCESCEKLREPGTDDVAGTLVDLIGRLLSERGWVSEP